MSYVINRSIEYEDFYKKLNSYIRFLESKNSPIHDKLAKVLKNKFLKQKEQINSVFARTVFREMDRVYSNVKDRFEFAYEKGSKELEGVVYSSDFVRKEKRGNLINYSLGNIDALIDATPISVQENSKSYMPPIPYRVNSWWIFQEYSGSMGKRNFKSDLVRRYVKARYGLGGYDKEPFITDGGELFSEDEAIIRALPKKVVREFVKVVKRGF